MTRPKTNSDANGKTPKRKPRAKQEPKTIPTDAVSVYSANEQRENNSQQQPSSQTPPDIGSDDPVSVDSPESSQDTETDAGNGSTTPSSQAPAVDQEHIQGAKHPREKKGQSRSSGDKEGVGADVGKPGGNRGNTGLERSTTQTEKPTQRDSTGGNKRKPSSTPPTANQPDEQDTGGVTLCSAAAGSEDSLPPPPGGLPYAYARAGESRAECWERLRKSARSAGLPRGQGPGTAYEYATQCVEVLFAPPAPAPEPEPEPEILEIPAPEQEPVTEPEPEPIVSPIGDAEPVSSTIGDKNQSQSDQDVGGLGDLPPDWPELPANASLQVEIAWVSANRLRVRDGTGVDLSRALSPAPSYSALSWLETSILFPAKFADISVKATANQDDEKELIRREKASIEEIRSILKEMLED